MAMTPPKITLNRARTALRIERKMVAKPGKRALGASAGADRRPSPRAPATTPCQGGQEITVLNAQEAYDLYLSMLMHLSLVKQYVPSLNDKVKGGLRSRRLKSTE
jgi:hypothetical protein